jgi:hypothetical protein
LFRAPMEAVDNYGAGVTEFWLMMALTFEAA